MRLQRPLYLADCLVRYAPFRILPSGTIGIMSSGRGSVANNDNGHEEVYRSSKAALNMFMRSFAARSSVSGLPGPEGSVVSTNMRIVAALPHQ